MKLETAWQDLPHVAHSREQARIRAAEAKKAWYADHEKRLNDAIIAAEWGEDLGGKLYRRIDDDGNVVLE